MSEKSSSRPEAPWALWTGLAGGLAAAVIGWETWRGLELERAVQEVSRMDGRQLDEAFERSPLNRDKYFLGAIAQNAAAGTALLDRIAALPGDEYYEAMDH